MSDLRYEQIPPRPGTEADDEGEIRITHKGCGCDVVPDRMHDSEMRCMKCGGVWRYTYGHMGNWIRVDIYGGES